MIQKKAPALLLAAVLTAASIFSCNSVPDADTVTDGTLTPEAGKIELTVYLDGYTADYLNALLDQFRREYPDAVINAKDFTALTIPDYRTKLANDLMSGEGPDILLTSYTTNNTLQNMTKLIQNGVFLDINELGCDLSGCNQAVMRAGIYDDKQYLVPLNYGIGFMISDKARIEKYKVDFSDDLDGFSDSLSGIYDAGKYVFSDLFTTEYLLRANHLDLIDYEKNMLVNDKTTKSALERLAECYLKLFPGVFEGSRSGDYRFVAKLKNYNGSLEQAYATGDLVFIGSPGFVGYLENISYMNSICESILKSGGTPVLSVLPSLDPESGIAPNVNYSLLVNSSTENKRSAKLFIESAVGIESQYICGMPMGIPVNGELVGKMREFYVDKKRDGSYTFNDECDFPKEFLERYFGAIDSLADGIYIDTITASKLFSVLREYASNGGDIDAAIEVGAKNVALYLSE